MAEVIGTIYGGVGILLLLAMVLSKTLGSKDARFYLMPMNHSFSADWDGIVNKLLDSGRPIHSTEHTMRFNHNGERINIWICNYPYAYGIGYGGRFSTARPSRKTINRIRKYQFADHSEMDNPPGTDDL